MTNDNIDFECIAYRTSVFDVIHPTVVFITPYDTDVGYFECYYRVSHPWLVSPRQDAPREVMVPVYEAGPSNPSLAHVSTLLPCYLQ